MGIALADVAASYGADVELVLGPVNIRPSMPSVKVTNVTTASEMAAGCIEKFKYCDIAILSAAVADFTPEMVPDTKIKRGKDGLLLKLRPTTDIAASLGKMKKTSQLLAGFALETSEGLQEAREKLIRKNLDIIVLNSLRDKGAGFGYDTNRITIIDKNNNIHNFELKTKAEAARDILDAIASMLKDG